MKRCLSRLTVPEKSSQTLEVQWPRVAGPYGPSGTNQPAGPGSLEGDSDGGFESTVTTVQFSKLWPKTTPTVIWECEKSTWCISTTPSDEQDCLSRYAECLAHPCAGQTEEILQPTEKGSRFPSLCWKCSSSHSSPHVQSQLYITSRRYFLG